MISQTGSEIITSCPRYDESACPKYHESDQIFEKTNRQEGESHKVDSFWHRHHVD